MTEPKSSNDGHGPLTQGEMYTPETWARVFFEPDVTLERVIGVVNHHNVDFSGLVMGKRPFILLCEAIDRSDDDWMTEAVGFALRKNQPMRWSYDRKDSVLYHLGSVCNQYAIVDALKYGEENGGLNRVEMALQLSAGIAPRYHEITNNLAQFQMEPFDLRLSIKKLSDYVREMDRNEQIEYFSKLSADELKMRFEFTSDHTQFTYAIERGYIDEILTSDRSPHGLSVLFNAVGKSFLKEHGFGEGKQAELMRLAFERQLRWERKRPKLR